MNERKHMTQVKVAFVFIVTLNSVLLADPSGEKKRVGAKINLAAEAKLTASHTTEGYDIKHAVDGNPATVWVGKGHPLTWLPTNVIIEFDKPRTVQRMVITSQKLRNLLSFKDFDIYAWAQNTWAGETPLAVVDTKDLTTVVDFDPVKTKSLRIRIRDTYYFHSFPRIVEMEIYQAGPGAKLKKLKDAPIPDEKKVERKSLALAFGKVFTYPRTKFDPAKGYLWYARSFADTMIAEGTDIYGKVHSPMFTSLIDMETHRHPGDDTPDNSPGQRYGDRSLYGGNLFQDVMLLRALDYISELTGNKKYRRAVTDYLTFFLKNCPRPETGLFPWGEHAYWNFYEEKPGSEKHEYLGGVPNSFWERLWKIDPEALQGEADGLLNHVTNLDNFHFDRHADIYQPLPIPRKGGGGMDFPRHAGFYIGLWTFAYSKTSDAKYLDWSQKMIDHHWRMRHPKSGLPPGRSGQKEAGVMTGFAEALNLLEAAQLLPKGEIRSRYKKVANAYMDSVLRLPHKPAKGQLCVSFLHNSTPEAPEEASYSAPYDYSYGGGFTADYANLMMAAFRMTGDKRALELAQGCARYYTKHKPPPITECVYARVYASIIGLFVDLYEIGKNKRYLNQAKRYARYAIENLYHNGLFRGATNIDHYEAEMMVGNLVYNLVWLHALDKKADLKIETNYFNR
jgi:hypothetical protein